MCRGFCSLAIVQGEFLMSDIIKTAYICGPLTELLPDEQAVIKALYVRIADAHEEYFGNRAFVPHEHYDPTLHANFLPEDVDKAERNQVCKKTSVLVVVAIAPSWGGGIEVEMANHSNVPAILFYPKGKKVSRLLKGNPAIREIIEYTNEHTAIWGLMFRIDRLSAI
jgi:hypothetical protein